MLQFRPRPTQWQAGLCLPAPNATGARTKTEGQAPLAPRRSWDFQCPAALRPRLPPPTPTPGRNGQGRPFTACTFPTRLSCFPRPAWPAAPWGPADRPRFPSPVPVSVPQSPDSDFTLPRWAGTADLRCIDHLVIVSIFPARDSIQRWEWTDDGCNPHETALNNHLSSSLDLRLAPTLSQPPAPDAQRQARPSLLVRCPVLLCLPSGLGVTQLARTWTDQDQSLLSPGHNAGEQPLRQSRLFPSTRRCTYSSCTPQHCTALHSMGVAAMAAGPSSRHTADRVSTATHGVQGVTCRASRLELAWAVASGSGLRWGATRGTPTRCEAKSRIDCASVLSRHARRHKGKRAPRKSPAGAAARACVSGLARALLATGGGAPSRTAHGFEQATVPVVGDSRHGRPMASLTSSRRKVELIGGPPPGKGADRRGQSALAYLRCTKGAGEGPGRGTPST